MCIRDSIYPNLTRELLETHSFYSLLYHVGVIPFSASDTYEAVSYTHLPVAEGI